MPEFFLFLLSGALLLAGVMASHRIWNNASQVLGIGVLVVGIALGLLVGITSVTAQYSVDRYQHLTFQEFYNGVETSTEMIPTTCYKDGSCFYSYRCAPYSEAYTDSHGKTKTRSVTHYCPYSTEEDQWVIHSTVGDITVAEHRLPAHYQSWDLFEPIPAWIIQRAGVGTPPDITAANAALARGDPRPATVSGVSYTNDILASDDVLVKEQSTDLERYRKAGLLPALATSTLDSQPDQADKVHFVGIHEANQQTWEEALMRVNMEAGSLHPPTTRFDIQVVIVDAKVIPGEQADDYTRALQAYWESPQYFGHGALPKNMAVFLVGTADGKTTWARGFTLIPTGNGVLWQEVQSPAPLGLVGVAMTPQALIGWPQAILNKPGHDGSIIEQRVIPSQGAIEQVAILGPDHFVRQHMTDHHFGSQGFGYLEGEIQPDFWTCVRIIVLSILFGLIVVNIVFGIVYKRSNV